MSKKDDELNEFIEEVNDGSYNLSCHEVILKFVNQIQTWGDTKIKKIVTVLPAEYIKISITSDVGYSCV